MDGRTIRVAAPHGTLGRVSAYEEILGLAWAATAGKAPEPVDAAAFRSRLSDRVDAVLEDSLMEDMAGWRERLRDVGGGLARQVIARSSELNSDQIEELSGLNKFAMALAVRFSAAITLDLAEGKTRYRNPS